MGQSIERERERDRRGFKELAKLAGSPQRPKASSVSGVRSAAPRADDSGMIDLAMLAAMDPSAVDRQSVTPLAAAAVSEEDADAPVVKDPPRSTPPSRRSGPPPIPASHAAPSIPGVATPVEAPASVPPPSMATPASAFIVSQAVPSVAPAAPSLAASEPKRGGKRLGIALALVATAAVAAGAFFVLHPTGTAVQASLPQSLAQAEVVGAAPLQVAVLSTDTAAPTPTPAAERGIDPMSLPKGTGDADHHTAPRAWHASHAAQALVAKADPDDVPGAVAKDDAKPAPVAAAAKPAPAAPMPPPASALLSVIKQAADSVPATAPPADDAPAVAPSKIAATTPAAVAASPAPVPAAATAGGSLGQRPSQGQVTGALGAALPDARSCLHEDDGVSRAHVVFGSDGAVQTVEVTGFAAGKPTEGCIVKALKRAHVPPFAEATYGATVTVRP